jgi:hypothetical protein
MSVFPLHFFVLSSFKVVLSDASLKQPKQAFTNQSTKTTQNLLFPGFVLSRFWALLGKGSSKTRFKNLFKKYDQPWYFFGPRGTNQPRQGPSQ